MDRSDHPAGRHRGGGDLSAACLLYTSYTAAGNGAELEALYTQVEAEEATGGTDIYYAAMEGLRQLENYDLSQYTPAIILLTDGVSDGSFSDFRDGYRCV